jgi:hypothetical protein
MSYQEFLVQQATASARSEKAIMRRMSRRASERRNKRAVARQGQRNQD